MAAWHKKRTSTRTAPSTPITSSDASPTLEQLASDGYLLFPEQDGSYTAWRRQQPPIPGVTRGDDVREAAPEYQAEWTLFPNG